MMAMTTSNSIRVNAFARMPRTGRMVLFFSGDAFNGLILSCPVCFVQREGWRTPTTSDFASNHRLRDCKTAAP